jgi:ABC-2 type transport system permease protein
MGFLAVTSYPLNLALTLVAAIFPLILAYFLGRIVQSSSTAIGGDYFLFFTLGLIGFLAVNRAISAVSGGLDEAIQQGRLEMFLMEPIRWREIPIWISLWPNAFSLAMAALAFGMAAGLGTTYRIAGMLPALLIILLGMISGLGIGILAGSIRVLSKREDPLTLSYTMVSSILAGQWFPPTVLPPWLRIFSWALPSTYVNSGLRRALMPHSSHIFGPTPTQAILGLLILNIVLYPLGLWLFGRSLGYGRKMGLLAGY